MYSTYHAHYVSNMNILVSFLFNYFDDNNDDHSTFLDALERIILDSQVYFHISNHKMSNLLADIRDESIAHHSKPHHEGLLCRLPLV